MNNIILILVAVIILQTTFSQEYEHITFFDSGVVWSEVYFLSELTWPDTIVKRPNYERFSLKLIIP